MANARMVTTVTIQSYVNYVDQVPTRNDSFQHLLKNQEQVNKNYPQSIQHSRLHIHQIQPRQNLFSRCYTNQG